MYVFVQTRVFLANALNAASSDHLTFDELKKFRNILAHIIYKETHYFDICDFSEQYYELSKKVAPDVFFYKSNDGFIIMQKNDGDNHSLISGDLAIDDELLKKINSHYIAKEDADIVLPMLEEARAKFKAEVPKLKPKKKKPGTTMAFSSYGFK